MGDRLVPTRAGNNWQVAFHMKEEINPATNLRNREGPPVTSDVGRDRSLFRCILENEVLNSGIEDPRELQNKKRRVFNVSTCSLMQYNAKPFYITNLYLTYSMIVL